MNTLPYIAAIVLTTGAALPAAAESRTANEIQRASTFSASVIAGAVAGGPLGMIAGALGGAYIAEKSRSNFEAREALAMEVTSLEQRFSETQLSYRELENRMANQSLEFQVMFPTGVDTLSEQDKRRIDALAAHLNSNAQLKVRLDGYADPRGTDEYNNVLSAERAKSVAEALKEKGVNEERITLNSHGANLASAVEANRDHYAFERRVHIEVFSDSNKDVAINE